MGRGGKGTISIPKRPAPGWGCHTDAHDNSWEAAPSVARGENGGTEGNRLPGIEVGHGSTVGPRSTPTSPRDQWTCPELELGTPTLPHTRASRPFPERVLRAQVTAIESAHIHSAGLLQSLCMDSEEVHCSVLDCFKFIDIIALEKRESNFEAGAESQTHRAKLKFA